MATSPRSAASSPASRRPPPGCLIAVVAKMAAPLFRKRLALGAAWSRFWPSSASRSCIGRCLGCSWRWRRCRIALAWVRAMNSIAARRAGRLFRAAVAVCGRRRQCRDPGNAPRRGRRHALDERPPVCRHVRDRAILAGAERDHRHADRLSRGGIGRRRGRDRRDVRADLCARLRRRAHLGPLQGGALAHGGAGRAGAGLARPDRRQPPSCWRAPPITPSSPGCSTAATALVAFATRINPLWLFAAGAVLGLTGWL